LNRSRSLVAACYEIRAVVYSLPGGRSAWELDSASCLVDCGAYPLDGRRRVERIANVARPHGAESCRGSRPASNAALFDILRLRGNLIALAPTLSRYRRASLEP
jgi:hypothetical protein